MTNKSFFIVVGVKFLCNVFDVNLSLRHMQSIDVYILIKIFIFWCSTGKHITTIEKTMSIYSLPALHMYNLSMECHVMKVYGNTKHCKKNLIFFYSLSSLFNRLGIKKKTTENHNISAPSVVFRFFTSCDFFIINEPVL